MTVTKKMVVDHLKAYLLGQASIDEIVSWAEDVMAEGEIEDQDFEVVREIVSRLGLGDVAAFGLTWEDMCEMLARLGYRAKVELEARV